MANSGIRRRAVALLIALVGAALAAGCATVETGGRPGAVPEIAPGVLQGYLPREALPDSVALLPAPPAKGSAAAALDEDVAAANVALRGSARWTLATADADLGFPNAAATFSCALGVPVTERDTPRLYGLLRRMLTDAGASTARAKRRYQRPRPFMVNREPMCTPSERAVLEKDGAYPSGHTAIGWAWALALAEIAPERTDAILARGRAFGESRIVCNVHWHSDVVEGRFIGAAVVARLHAVPAFRADLQAAGAELAAARARGLGPSRDCAAEAAALAR